MKLCFNSTLVQLKVKYFLKNISVEELFQFYLSSIKREPKKKSKDPKKEFQFYLSSIKRD